MSFKEGDVIFVSEANLKIMCIPLREGPLFTLRNRNLEGVKAYWETENRYIVLEQMLQHPTELLMALL